MFEDDYKENNYISSDYEDEDEDEFGGYSIVDASGADISEIKKIYKKAVEEDEPTIATPIPENEQTVIIENVSFILPKTGRQLSLKLSAAQGEVWDKKIKVGELKAAFVKKLYETRAGQFARVFMHSDVAPVMVRLVFTDKPEDGAVEIV